MYPDPSVKGQSYLFHRAAARMETISVYEQLSTAPGAQEVLNIS